MRSICFCSHLVLNCSLPPILPSDGGLGLAASYADPVPQALILTAIVISFGLTAFAVVLLRQTYQTIGVDDLDELQNTDGLSEPDHSLDLDEEIIERCEEEECHDLSSHPSALVLH